MFFMVFLPHQILRGKYILFFVVYYVIANLFYLIQNLIPSTVFVTPLYSTNASFLFVCFHFQVLL